MDINDLRSAVTVISLLLFVWLVAMTMKRSRRVEYEEAAQLPFVDEAVQLPFADKKTGEDRS